MRRRQPPHEQKPQTAKQQENERLAQALRDNLHRRKVQARARASASVYDVDDLAVYDAIRRRDLAVLAPGTIAALE